MLFTVEVATLTAGTAEEKSALQTVNFSFDHEVITTRELIARTVEEQVRCLNASREQSVKQRRGILERRYLSDEDIEKLTREGRISTSAAGGEETLLDTEREIQKALYGFKQQRFFITVNGWQPETLDDNILLTPHSKVAFIRLMPLVGG